jgi:hypothetical protein
MTKTNVDQSDELSNISSSEISKGSKSSQASTCVYSDDPDRDEENVEFNQAPFLARNKIELENEIKSFTEILDKMKLEKKQNFTTRQFWEKYRERLPNLNRLALLLTSIPASSAFIERFFSFIYSLYFY